MGGTTLAWFTFLGVSTWRWERDNIGRLPPPRIYLGTAVLFSMLGLLARPAPQLAATMGWALVLAELIASPDAAPSAVSERIITRTGPPARPSTKGAVRQ